ncbi:molecular chaperone (plasmid) [Pantoea dispersa]|uniref:Molecular chaperone n=1 Tax=Pantoea dispersa TaxID=59814 RepID=A0ABY2ZT67_9GAMM|nr:molecular chaperone [Pantoea dispersa]TQC70003.1 molecular chaperone [Pantoea dispersa]
MKCYSHFFFFSFLFTSLGLHAAVVPLQDRVLFSGNDSDRRLLIVNNDRNAPVLLQSWIDDGSSDGLNKEKNYPFIVIPAVEKMSPGKIVNLRVLPTEKIRELPMDRESVFWINLYEIPGIKKSQQRENVNKVEMGLNTQLKIIYRPFMVHMDIKKIAEGLSVRLSDSGHSLELDNPSPYYVTPVSIKIKYSSGEQPLQLGMSRMIAPFSHKRYGLTKVMNSKEMTVEYTLVDDSGKDFSFTRHLKEDSH